MGNKEELIKEARELAEDYYSSGKYLCSEAVLSAVNEVLAYEMPQEYISLMSGFPVGMGGAGCSCGALSGAQAALGLAFGRKRPGKNNTKVMKLGKEVHNRFKEKNGSTCCRVLIREYEFGSKEHIKRCTRVTGETCEIVTRMILENKGFLKGLQSHKI